MNDTERTSCESNSVVITHADALDKLGTLLTKQGYGEAAQALQGITEERAGEFLECFIQGSIKEDYTQFTEMASTLPDTVKVLLSPFLQHINTPGSVQKIKYDNSAVLAQLNDDLRKQKTLTQMQTMVFDMEVQHQALKQHNALLEVNNMAQQMYQTNVLEEAKRPTREESIRNMLQNRATRDTLVKNESLRKQALQLGLMTTTEGGDIIWVDK